MKNRFLFALILIVLLPDRGDCATTTDQQVKPLHPVDWALLILYGTSMIFLGWYFGRRQKTAKEYFIGSGSMSPFFVGVSLFATLLSTISYLSMPGEAAGKGPVANLTMIATLPLVFLVVGFVLIPVYLRHRVTSAYELLESKLGLSIRLLGATMFLILRLVWMSLLIYLAAEALVLMLRLDPKWLTIVVLITGAVSVVYASIGGLRAVVVTDFLQTLLLFGGAVMVIAIVTWRLGGFQWFPTTWQSNWDTQPFFSTNPGTRLTMVGSMLSIFTWFVATSGGDQVSVQRFMSTADAKAARRAVLTQMCTSAVVAITLCLVGFALLAYFQANPDHLRKGMDIKKNADSLFPLFISEQLPVGIRGLVIAAMFAAAMSSMDSGVNSITAVVSTDFLGRSGRQPKSEWGQVIFARILALCIGGIVIASSTLMQHVSGNITAVTQKTVNLLTTPIFGLFFFALFVPFARPIGVWLGAVCGILTAATIAFSGPLVELLYHLFGVAPETFGTEWVTAKGKTYVRDPISFQWIGPTALLVNITVGMIVSALFRKRDNAKA